ncbi:MAG: hypothetical protein CR978_02405 [Gammaproteobacteria bacterium]|nr:MAG: hypothetical protein CR978_02405 [Gammaproteobacteria bacterium]
MQIEEGFRDMKSSRFGLGFELNASKQINRLNILIFLTTLTAFVAVLVGIGVALGDLHRRFQSNTVKRRILSYQTLGLRAVATRLKLPPCSWQSVSKWLRTITNDAWLGGTA